MPFIVSDTLAKVFRSKAKPIDSDEKLMAFKTVSNYPLFFTRGHRELLDVLLEHGGMLQENAFIGSNGSHCRLLVAAKGIGKSTVFELFTSLCRAVYPDVIPMYISFNQISQSVFKSKDVVAVVADNLIEAKILSQTEWDTIGVKDSEPFEAITAALRRDDKRLFLLVDEIDQLYRAGPSEIRSVMTADECTVTDSARRTLDGLSAFGNLRNGTIGVFLCGSSASCPQLVTKSDNRSLLTEFPLLSIAPDLNGTRYKTHRVYASRCVELDTVKQVLSAFGSNVSDELARQAAFVAGSNPRALQDAAKHGFDLWTAISGGHTASEGAQRDLSGDVGVLFCGIMKALKDRNKAVLADLLDKDGILCPMNVRTVPWEKRFRALSWDDAMAVVPMVGAHDVSWRSVALQGLADRGYLCLHSVADGAPRFVYPGSLALLFRDSWQAEADLHEQKSNWKTKLRDVKEVAFFADDCIKFLAATKAALVAAGYVS
jgi:hypothetical protein